MDLNAPIETARTGRQLLDFSIDNWVLADGTHWSAAAKIGISPSALSNILRGLRPTPRQMVKIEKAFGVPRAAWTDK